MLLQLHPEKVELEDARMTSEQLKELAEALSVLSTKSSVLKERDELRTLMDENLQAEEVRILPLNPCSQLTNILRTLSLLQAH